VLRSSPFQQDAQTPVVANVPVEDRWLLIYRNLGEVASEPHLIDPHLPIIGKTIEGAVGRC